MSREASREHYAPGTSFQIGRIDLVANTGTHVDAPFHRFADGRDLADLPLESLADLDGCVVARVGRDERAIDVEAFDGIDVRGRSVLVRTDWSRHWQTPRYFDGHPFLTRAAAVHLSRSGARFVGIDSLNIDDTRDRARPVHTILLESGIPICKHLTHLDALPHSGFRFHAVPVEVRTLGTFPVRAYAIVRGPDDVSASRL